MQGKLMNYSCAHTIIVDDQFAPSVNEGAFFCSLMFIYGLLHLSSKNADMWYNDYFMGMHFFWWILWVLMVVWIFYSAWSFGQQKEKKDSPLDILKKRFAKGEINKEEYEERKSILQQDITGK